LQTAAEESKAAARKLEHRLTGALDTEGLQAKANKYKAKVIIRSLLVEGCWELKRQDTNAYAQSAPALSTDVRHWC
jgi:hypothetical protein